MPRKVVIHSGFHKTGTSTVQQALRENRRLLQPHLAVRLKGQMKELMHATRGYSMWRDPLTLAKATRRFGAVLDGLVDMPRRVLVISAEELSGHMPGRDNLLDYSAAPILLKRFCSEIADRFPHAEQAIYFSTRAPDEWLKSAYWEHVKSSSMTLGYDVFARSFRGATDFEKVISDVQEGVTASVHSCPLETSANLPLGPADPLFDLCDMPLDLRAKIIPKKAENRRYDDAVLLALLDANRAYADRDERKAVKQKIMVEAQKNDQ